MSINIGNNNKFSNSNIGNEYNNSQVDNSVNKSTIEVKKFYQKEGFWGGVITGVLSSLISSGIIWGITELVKIFLTK